MDLTPVWLTLKLAGLTSLILLVIGTPIAWWLTHTRRRIKPAIEALVAMPLVLPPTVLGFYLLILLSPTSPIGALWKDVTGSTLTFSFTGLVIASVLYSLPFAVQPLHGAFEIIGRKPLEAAWCMRASKFDAFVTVIMPLALRGYITALVLSFAHTLGEFGIVLMVGGNIPGKTQVLSIAIYDRVEALDYATAHTLSAGLLVFAFICLFSVYILNRRFPMQVA